MSTATLRHDRNNPIELPAEFLDELWPATPERPVVQAADRVVVPEPRRGSAPMLEVLNGALMLFRSLSGRKRSKILPAA